jgi:predicted enzyme related to lactoylglutathione lyase
MITSIAFTVYPVSDMMKARRFYEHTLGLGVTYNYREQWVEYDIGAGTFAITTMDTGQVAGVRGAEVGFEVPDLDGFVEGLRGKAVQFVTDLFDTPVCRMAVIEDPDHNHIVLRRLDMKSTKG